MPRTYRRLRFTMCLLRSRYANALLVCVCTLLTLDFLHLSWTSARQQQQPPAVLRGPAASRPPPIAERVFIASTHWNNEAILRSHWNAAVLELVRHIGPQNAFVSVCESGSWDDSKGALRQLDAALGQLGAPRAIVLDDTTHADEIAKTPAATGWIDTPRGRKELRRIPYLSAVRNRSLKPLEELAAKGIVFDKILFLNDVVFTVRCCCL